MTTETHKEQQFLIMHLDGSDLNLSHYKDAEAAWEANSSQPPSNMSEEQYKAEYVGSIVAYSMQEAVESHNKGYDWPAKLGIVDPDNVPVFASSDDDFDLVGDEAIAQENPAYAAVKFFFGSDGYDKAGSNESEPTVKQDKGMSL